MALKKTMILLAGVVAMAIAITPVSAFAATLVISNDSPAWLLLPNSIGNGGAGTYGLPADLTAIGCGTENEPTCEPTGVFTLSSAITTAAGYYTISDADGVGDVLVFGNTGPGGTGQILFYSDPDLPVLTSLTGINYGTGCVEDPASGCIATFFVDTAVGIQLKVEGASDGENVFDPFGYGFDTSDQIRFSGQGVSVPEPATLALFGLGLGYVARRRRRA